MRRRLYSLAWLVCMHLEREASAAGEAEGLHHTEAPCVLCDRAHYWRTLRIHYGRQERLARAADDCDGCGRVAEMTEKEWGK